MIESNVKNVAQKWDNLYLNEEYNVQYPFDQIVSFIYKNKSLVHGANVLDVGCGLGNNFAPVIDLGGVPIGIDGSATALKKCAERYPSSLVYNVCFDDLWPIASESISVGYDRMSLTCNPMNTIKVAFNEIYRVLKTGGIFRWIVLSDSSDYVRSGEMSHDGWVEQSNIPNVLNNTQFRGYSFLSYKDVISITQGFKIERLELMTSEVLVAEGMRKVQAYWVVDCVKAT